MTEDDEPPTIEDFTFGDPESELPDLDPEEVDADTEIVLATLRRAGEPMGTGAIREETTQEQNKPVLDRLNRLSRNGLTRVARTEELPGAAADRQYWELTDRGTEWVDQHTLSVTPTTADLLEDTLQHTVERMTEIEEEFSEIDTRLRGWQDTMDRRASKLNRLSKRASEAKKKAKTAREDVYIAKNTANNVEADLKDTQADLDDLENEVEALRQSVDNLRSHLKRVERDQTDQQERLMGEIQRLGERVSEAEQAAARAEDKADRGLLDRLLPGR